MLSDSLRQKAPGAKEEIEGQIPGFPVTEGSLRERRDKRQMMFLGFSVTEGSWRERREVFPVSAWVATAQLLAPRAPGAVRLDVVDAAGVGGCHREL